MSMRDKRLPDLPIDNELDELIREALLEAVGTSEPSSLVWSRIRAEVEADRVPIWVAWWRRARLIFADKLPRLISNAVVISLFLLLGGLSLRGYGFFDGGMALSGSGSPPGDQRQVTLAERRFYEHYPVVYYVVPVDAPPKAVRRTAPRSPAPPTGPKHLVVEAMNPS